MGEHDQSFTNPSVTSPPPEGEYRHVVETLTRAIRWLRVGAVVLFIVGAAAAIVAVWQLPALTGKAADKIIASGNSPVLMLFELLRGAAFAATVAAVLWGLFNLARAAIDQATRYQKRLVAAYFLSWVLLRYDDQIRSGTMHVNEAVTFMKMWSESVDSAFTNVKFGKGGRAEPVRFGVGPNGVTLDTNRANGTPAPTAG